MKMYAILLLGLLPLLSGRPVPHTAPFWEATVNNDSPYSIAIDAKFYDAATGAVYGEETFSVVPGDSYQTLPYLIQGAQPVISITWSTAPTAATMNYNALNANNAYIPNGLRCRSITQQYTGSNIYDANPVTHGYGNYTFDFEGGSGCP